MKQDRNKVIVRTSIAGIVINAVLVAFKMIVGLFANSIAIILDAVNNLSDALSSVITIIGTKLAGKAPDKKHPYGYGRIEYITSVIIAVIVLLAGITSIRESFVKIFEPDETSYSIASLIIIAVAVIVKFLTGTYVKKVGKSVFSQSLIASGSDALFDSVLSLATLVGAVLSLVWGLQLEGILGVVISVIIIKAGIEMLIETLNSIIGTRAEAELTQRLKERIGFYEGVNGVYDIALHNYGPTKIYGSAHIEVDDDKTAGELHTLTRRITEDVFVEFGIILTLGIYAAHNSGKAAELRKIVEAEAGKMPEIVQMHGFYIDDEKRNIMFDLIVDFDYDAQKVCSKLYDRLTKQIPDYNISIILDSDISD